MNSEIRVAVDMVDVEDKVRRVREDLKKVEKSLVQPLNVTASKSMKVLKEGQAPRFGADNVTVARPEAPANANAGKLEA